WDAELGAMRDRIKLMRKALVDGIHLRVPGSNFAFILEQRGMFSYSGLSRDQVLRLRGDYSIYTIETGRICVAALTTRNLKYVADAIAKVIKWLVGAVFLYNSGPSHDSSIAQLVERRTVNPQVPG